MKELKNIYSLLHVLQKGGYEDTELMRKFAKLEVGWLGLEKSKNGNNKTKSNQSAQHAENLTLTKKIVNGIYTTPLPSVGTEARFTQTKEITKEFPSGSVFQWDIGNSNTIIPLFEQIINSGNNTTLFINNFNVLYRNIMKTKNNTDSIAMNVYGGTVGNPTSNVYKYIMGYKMIKTLHEFLDEIMKTDFTNANVVYQWMYKTRKDEQWFYKLSSMKVEETIRSHSSLINLMQISEFINAFNSLMNEIKKDWMQDSGNKPNANKSRSFLYKNIAKNTITNITAPLTGIQQQKTPRKNENIIKEYQTYYSSIQTSIESKFNELKKKIKHVQDIAQLVKIQFFALSVASFLSFTYTVLLPTIKSKSLALFMQWNVQYWDYLQKKWLEAQMRVIQPPTTPTTPTTPNTPTTPTTPNTYSINKYMNEQFIKTIPSATILWGWGGIISTNIGEMKTTIDTLSQTIRTENKNSIACVPDMKNKIGITHVKEEIFDEAKKTLKFTKNRNMSISENQWTEEMNKSFKSLEEKVPVFISQIGCLREGMEREFSLQVDYIDKRRVMGKYLDLKWFYESFFRLGANTQKSFDRANAYGMDMEKKLMGNRKVVLGHWSSMGFFLFENARKIETDKTKRGNMSKVLELYKNQNNRWIMHPNPKTGELEWTVEINKKTIYLHTVISGFSRTDYWSVRDPSCQSQSFWRRIWEANGWFTKNANAPLKNIRLLFISYDGRTLCMMNMWEIIKTVSEKLTDHIIAMYDDRNKKWTYWKGENQLSSTDIATIEKNFPAQMVMMPSNENQVSLKNSPDFMNEANKVINNPQYSKYKMSTKLMMIPTKTWKELLWDVFWGVIPLANLPIQDDIFKNKYGSMGKEYIYKNQTIKNALWKSLNKEWIEGVSLILPNANANANVQQPKTQVQVQA